MIRRHLITPSNETEGSCTHTTPRCHRQNSIQPPPSTRVWRGHPGMLAEGVPHTEAPSWYNRNRTLRVQLVWTATSDDGISVVSSPGKWSPVVPALTSSRLHCPLARLDRGPTSATTPKRAQLKKGPATVSPAMITFHMTVFNDNPTDTVSMQSLHRGY